MAAFGVIGRRSSGGSYFKETIKGGSRLPL